MSEQVNENEAQFQQDKIVGETARISWRELEVFYAKGIVILLGPELNLIQVAQCLAEDATEQIEAWIQSEQIVRTFDEKAKSWSENNFELWSVVIKPWILVQEPKRLSN